MEKQKFYIVMALLFIVWTMIVGGFIYIIVANNNKGSEVTVNGRPQNNNNNPVTVSADDDPFLGRADAPVTIIEFSDFQCPFCRTFWKETLPQIKQEYIDKGKVKLVYRDFPLSFHPSAMPAAQASECADEQGKFWEMHDVIFQEQEKQGEGTITFTVNDLKNWALKIGLDASQFNQCLDSEKYKTEVEKDGADGSLAGVNGTPAFFVNNQLLAGAQPFSAFKTVIDRALEGK